MGFTVDWFMFMACCGPAHAGHGLMMIRHVLRSLRVEVMEGEGGRPLVKHQVFQSL